MLVARKRVAVPWIPSAVRETTDTKGYERASSYKEGNAESGRLLEDYGRDC